MSVKDFVDDARRERPAAVDEIVGVLNIEALVVLGIACAILIVDIAANSHSDVAFDLWGVPGLVVGAAGLFLVKLTRDFRSLRPWTLPYVRFVLGLSARSRAYEKKLERPDVRRAFGR